MSVVVVESDSFGLCLMLGVLVVNVQAGSRKVGRMKCVVLSVIKD